MALEVSCRVVGAADAKHLEAPRPDVVLSRSHCNDFFEIRAEARERGRLATLTAVREIVGMRFVGGFE